MKRKTQEQLEIEITDKMLDFFKKEISKLDEKDCTEALCITVVLNLFSNVFSASELDPEIMLDFLNEKFVKSIEEARASELGSKRAN